VSKTIDERIAPRVETDTTIFVELRAASKVNATEADIVICKTVNLSLAGLQVALDKPVPTGSILRLCLDISEYDPLFIVAEVMWQQFNAATEETYVGFKILRSNGTDYAAWEAAMAERFAQN
jgi:hypothetical protein